MSLLPVDDALVAIIKALTAVDAEEISMADAACGDVMGRVLAEDIYAVLDHPPHDVSAMDGFAVRGDDITTIPASLEIIGESAAGHPFGGNLDQGQAVRIFTGAYCPDGSDTIIIQENTKIEESMITVQEAAPKGKFIRPRGNDFSQGDLIAQKGALLTPRLLSLMASAGVTVFKLHRRPKIAIISTGDELVAPGEAPKDGQIISSNGLFLKTYLSKIGAEVIDIGIISDEKAALDHAFEKAAAADLIVTSGGASVGSHDGVAKAMNDGSEADLNFWQIAMRPGKPLIFGTIKGTPMIGLPGNPVSTGVCAMVFVNTALKTLSGQDISVDRGLDLRQGRLTTSLKENDKRQDYLRAKLSYGEDGMAELTPFDQQDSGMMKRFAEADALVVRPPFAEAAKIGDMVRYIRIPRDI